MSRHRSVMTSWSTGIPSAILSVVTLALMACGRSSLPSPPVDEPPPVRGGPAGAPPASAGGPPVADPGSVDRPCPRGGCIGPYQASKGTTPTPARHVMSCSFLESDDLGSVAKGSRTFDSAGRITSERNERLDDPPRTTVHDYTYVPPPRKTFRVVEYDSEGRVTHEMVDDNIDAIVELERRWTFDGQGHETSMEASDGTSTTRNAKSYDAGGFLALEDWFFGGVLSTSTRWIRRGDGEPLVSSTFWRDPGVVQSTTTWSYDGNGTLQHKETTQVDGKPVETNDYDGAGRLIEQRTGWNERTDAVRQFSYDASGNTLRDHRFDTSGREIEDRVSTYDPKGHMLTTWHRWGFGFAAGPTTDFDEYTVGACGEVISASHATGGKTATTAWFAFDQAGHIISSEQTTLLPGPGKSRTTSSFDDEGHLTHVRGESLVAGEWKLDYENERVFDTAGHLLLDQTTYASSPGNVTREAWQFDARGDLVLYESNANFGRHKVRVESDYGCLY